MHHKSELTEPIRVIPMQRQFDSEKRRYRGSRVSRDLKYGSGSFQKPLEQYKDIDEAKVIIDAGAPSQPGVYSPLHINSAEINNINSIGRNIDNNIDNQISSISSVKVSSVRTTPNEYGNPNNDNLLSPIKMYNLPISEESSL